MPDSNYFKLSSLNSDSVVNWRFYKSGIYDISLTADNMCSTVTKTLPLVVQGKPSLQMPANQNICGLTTIDFTDSVYEPIVYDSLATATYQWVVLPNSGWSFIGGTNATDKNPKIEFLQYGTYTVRLTVTNDCGTITDQTLFNINQGPILQTLADTNLCFESSISFTALAT